MPLSFTQNCLRSVPVHEIGLLSYQRPSCRKPTDYRRIMLRRTIAAGGYLISGSAGLEPIARFLPSGRRRAEILVPERLVKCA